MSKNRDTLDKRKVIIELLKYIGTLSFGAIVLISGFLRNLTEFPGHEVTVLVVVCSFFLCIVFSVATYVVVAKRINLHAHDWSVLSKRFATACIACALGAFFVGLLGLMYFVVVNIGFTLPTIRFWE